ncbi:unconventional myosin-XVB [Cetorhinus maximus]
MNVKKKLLMGMKVKAKEESKGTGQAETKQESKTREKFLKVQVQHRYPSRMCEAMKRNAAEKQYIKQGDQSGDEQNLEESTDVKTIPSLNILSHQSHLIHSLRTKSRDVRARSKQPLTSAAAGGGLSQLVKVAVKIGKTQQGALVQEKPTGQTSGKERRWRSSSAESSDAEDHLDEDQIPCPQNLEALIRQKKIAKVVGKVKLASIRKRKARTLKTEENTAVADVIEPEPGSPRIEGNSCQRFSAIRRVTGWICRQIPKILQPRSKLVAVTKVIGTTEWLSKTLSMKQKNKHGKSGGFRRRMAIRFASTAEQVSRKGHSPGITNTDLNVGEEGTCQLLVVNNTTPCSTGGAETMAPDDIELVPEMEANGQNKHHRSEDQSDVEEKFSSSDAKYAIVLPRVHRLVKSKATVLASCRSERAHGDSPQPYKVAVSAQPDYLYMDASGRPQSRHRDKLHALGDITQSNSERKTSKHQPKDARIWRAKNVPHCQDIVTSPRLVNKLLRKDQEKRKIALSDPNRPFPSHLRTDPQQQVKCAQDTEYFQDMKEIHWAQRGHFNSEHLTWLDSETLLPHPTIKNLNKWTIYKEQDIIRTSRRTGAWESEDTVEDVLEKDFKYKQPTLSENHRLETKDVEDLSNLEEVCESSVLLSLKRRFHRDIIYTYIGNILVSVNPYKHVGIYIKDRIKQFRRRDLSENPPHIFAIADAAYTLSQSLEREQCIMVSGQSGSGKTEAAKLIIHYLTALYQDTREERVCQVAEAFPILEAFGNAKTVLNDNSSRFGKLLWIHIRQGRVVGSSISHYLLEKSRLVFQAHNERNYHVFYELLAGLDEEQKRELSLQESETYFYLNQGGACEITGKYEHEDFLCLLGSLGRIGLLEEQLITVWSILSSILQLGNVCFTSYEDGSQELAVIVSHTEIRIVANLLQVSSDTLHSVITQRVTETSYDRIFSPLSVESSIDARDSIAKALYSLLFNWLVQQTNAWLMPVEMDSSVGIVDVYGFEDLGVNSFEQLCINYANEQLQHFFSQSVLTQEQEEYSQEQIDWAFIPVSDRQNCLDLITAKPHGILRILDDQTNLPQATDHTFLQKCHYQHSNNPWYVKPKLPLPVFTIRHYAGAVTYQVHKFLDKNRDQLRPEVLELFIHSRNKMIADLFKRAQENLCQQKRIGSNCRGHRYQSPTVATKFQHSLSDLITRLKRCNPFFIRCIKPNIKKIPGQFDVECIGAQLRHSGIMEVIHIRKEGYPVRILLLDFISRYSILLRWNKENSSDSELCSSILEKITEGTPGSYQLGLTKVFLKKQLFNQLENCWRKTQNWAALTIQKNIRGFINRKNFHIFKQKIVVIQSHIRGHQARARYKRLKRTFVRFGTAVVISRAVAHKRRNQTVEVSIQAMCTSITHSSECQASPMDRLVTILKGQTERNANAIVSMCSDLHTITPALSSGAQSDRGTWSMGTDPPPGTSQEGRKDQTVLVVEDEQQLPPSGSTSQGASDGDSISSVHLPLTQSSISAAVTEDPPATQQELSNVVDRSRPQPHRGCQSPPKSSRQGRWQVNLSPLQLQISVQLVREQNDPIVKDNNWRRGKTQPLDDTKEAAKTQLYISEDLDAMVSSRLRNATEVSIGCLKGPCCEEVEHNSDLQSYRHQDVGSLEIPAELAALLQLAERQPPAVDNQIAEVSLPQVKAVINVSLPADVNSFPFSKFINQHFQVPQLQVLNEPLQQPLTHLRGAERQAAVELFKLILRFLQDESLQGRKEIILGNFIAQKGISNPTLRSEIFCQVMNQIWKNPDMEEWQRACLLMATCLSCLRPSPELEKPLLKYVSDHAMEEYRALCQHKALGAMQQNHCRTFPPTQLEWTANRRRGQMVLDIHLLNEDKVATEVESWTTGEELANWILKFRGQEDEQRGWTVSLHTSEEWRDMPGCDFVMDLIAEIEELGFFPAQSPTSVIQPGEIGNFYGSHSSSDECYLSLPEESEGVIPPAPNVQAPNFPPAFLSQDRSQADLYSYSGSTLKTETSQGSFENYVDNLFDPVFSHGGGEMERSRDLNRQMKGGGGIGPTQTGVYMTTGMPMAPNYLMGAAAMPQIPAVPAYQTMPLMPAMQPMPAMQQIPAMQQMPVIQSVPMMQPMAPSMPAHAQQPKFTQFLITIDLPGDVQMSTARCSDIEKAQSLTTAIMMPQSNVSQMASVHQTSQYPRSHFSQPESRIDSSQLAAQQQTFINQQALLLAQQMTNQAMSISQQQQQEQQQKKQQKRPQEQREERQPVPETPKATLPPKTNTKPTLPAPSQQPKKASVKKEPLVNEDLPKEKEVPPRDMTPPPANSIKETQCKEKEKEKEQSAGDETKEPEMVKSSQGTTRPEPSQNIREIIKLYQSQPKPPPPLYQPIRRSAKPFLKKSNPKDEALSVLGMRRPASPPEAKDSSAIKETPPAKVPPKPLPKPQNFPLSSQRSIQDQLTRIFSPPATEPPLPPLPPPPPFDPPSPSTSTSEFQFSALPQKRGAVLLQDEDIKTHLYRRTASVYFSYINIPWKLYLRKELFYPRERFNNDYILNLMCEQIIQDTYSDSCLRISKEERRKMRDLLAELHVGTDAQLVQDNGLKKRIVVAARDNWAVYFSRLFPVCSDIGSNVEVLSVSHRGIKLLKSVKAVGMNTEYYKVLQSYSYVEILSVTLQEETILELALKTEQLVLYSEKAKQAKALITLFLEELQKDSKHVMAIKSYITDDKCLLNFHKGDIIKLLPMDGLEPGWQFGSIGGRSGIFPGDHAQPTAAPDYYSSNVGKNKEWQKSTPSSNRSSTRTSVASTEVSEKTTISTSAQSLINPPSSVHSSPEFGQYIMTEFAMKYFREPVTMNGWKGMNAEGKNPNHLVRHTKVPIQESLIYIVDNQLSELAAKNFMALMRFMGDQPPEKHQSDKDYVQSILQLCKEKELLHDEICCQIIKQVTDNPKKESCMRGWRTLYLFLGYYPCTSNLRPFVLNYLEDICTNSKHDFQEIAKVCLDNIRRNLQFGGRQRAPSSLEMEAIIKGRSSRRVIVYLPGKLEHTAKIRPFSVGNEIVMEICATIGINDSEEAKEFSLFADRNNGKVVRPIKCNEYIFDFLLDDNSISLQFRRITWKEPLHFYNDLYVNVHYNQVLPIYLKGQLHLPNNIREAEQFTAMLAAYQHRTKGAGPVPNGQQLQAYLPKTTMVNLNLEPILKQTIQELYTMHTLSPLEAKISFLRMTFKGAGWFGSKAHKTHS